MATSTSTPAHDRESRAERMSQTADLLTRLVDAGPVRRRRLEQEVVELNMGVARDVARRYRDRGIPLDDLEQVAYVGLIKAVRGFEPAAGHEFLSFAVPTIRGEVRRWFRDAGWTVRPPRSVQELQARCQRAQEDLVHRLGRAPTVEELAEAVSAEPADVRRAQAAQGCFAPASLDHATGDDESALSTRLGVVEPGFARTEATVALAPVLRRLSERERTLLGLRFVHGESQADIGARLGVTQTQVSRRLSSLLLRLRTQLDVA